MPSRFPRPESQRVSTLAWALIVAVIALVMSNAVTWIVLGSVSDSVLVNRQTGFKNRAVACETIILLHGQLPSPCLDAEVVRYYAPAVP